MGKFHENAAPTLSNPNEAPEFEGTMSSTPWGQVDK